MSNTATIRRPDPQAIEAFEDRLAGALNEAGMLLMISIGHRAGLFAALDGAPPLTSAELAERTGLQERYVREWLGALTAAGVIEMDPRQGRYHLPPEHTARLTDNAEANLGVYAQFVPMEILSNLVYDRFDQAALRLSVDGSTCSMPSMNFTPRSSLSSH